MVLIKTSVRAEEPSGMSLRSFVHECRSWKNAKTFWVDYERELFVYTRRSFNLQVKRLQASCEIIEIILDDHAFVRSPNVRVIGIHESFRVSTVISLFITAALA